MEDESRYSLLQHFSSKSSHQTNVILTIALVSVGVLQALPYIEAWPIIPKLLFHVSCPFVLVLLGIRATGKLLMWGKYASAVLHVKPLEECEYTEKGVLKQLPEKHLVAKIAEEVPLAKTYLIRLYHACNRYVEADMRNRHRHDIFRLASIITSAHSPLLISLSVMLGLLNQIAPNLLLTIVFACVVLVCCIYLIWRIYCR